MYIPNDEEIQNFVRESNAIEGIAVGVEDPLFVDHVSAVNYVIETLKEGNLPFHYPFVHKILLDSESEKCPGLYRHVGVRVGQYKAPRPERILSLMCQHYENILIGPKKEQGAGKWAWDMHCEFESIHPFVDGNGRVGRIVMNALRLFHGLPWLTIPAEERHDYYIWIEIWRYENSAFLAE